MCNSGVILDGLVLTEFKAAQETFHCLGTITSVQATRSRLACGVLCSLKVDCLMYGYNSTSQSSAHQPGICAITSTVGPAVQTEYTFQWFTQEW